MSAIPDTNSRAVAQETAGGVVESRISGMYDIDSADPDSILINRDHLSPEDIAQISELMNALGELRDAENVLSEASRRYMKLNDTDMRALHFLIICSHRGQIATPGAIAQHLHISTASTTKLIDRLARDGHVVRSPHPHDRRALVVSITEATHRDAMATVGKQHSGRFAAAARLDRSERETVIRFIRDMTAGLSLSNSTWASEHH